MGGSPVIKDLHFVRKRLASGGTRWYIYAWRGGPQVMVADGLRKPKLTPGTVDAIASARKGRDQARQPDPTTLASLIRKWRSSDPTRPSSPEWERLAPNTRKIWGYSLDRIEGKWGEVPLELFNDTRMIEKVINWRDSRAATPRAADMGIDVLRALLKYGVQRGLLRINVAEKIGRLYVKGQRAEIVWTDQDLRLFAAAAGKKEEHVEDAVLLASVTGLRREDLARLTWAEIREFAIIRKAAKASRGTRRFATIPRIPALDTVLERLRSRYRAAGVETVLVTSAGQPWNLGTLTKEITRIIKKAGIVHVEESRPGEPPIRRRKHLHDLRGTFATQLMTTTDLANETVAEIMGWSPDEVKRIRMIYVDGTAQIMALGRRIGWQAQKRVQDDVPETIGSSFNH